MTAARACWRIGAMSVMHRTRVDAVRVSDTVDGQQLGQPHTVDVSLRHDDAPMPLSAAVGHRPDGSPVVAFGMDDGSVKLWDPAVTSPTLLAEVTGSATRSTR